MLHGKRLPEERWESVLLEALHAIRSLVCISTNETPHERLFRFSRKAMFGAALPSWLLSPGTVLLRRFVRNKGEPLCDPVELVEANGNYAVIRHRDGQESTVSTSDLALYPRPHEVQTQRPSESPSSKTPRFLEHSTPTQLTTVITARHHVTVNLCLTTARQRQTVIRLYPCCVVLHDSDDPLTVTGNGRFNRKHLPFAYFYLLGRL